MRLAPWFRPRHSTLAVFLGTMFVLGAALAVLCWQLLEQDRQLETQRERERLEGAADRIQSTLEAGLREFERLLPALLEERAATPPDGVTLLLAGAGGIRVQPSRGLLYQPPPAPLDGAPETAFDEGERMEFQLHSPAGAAEVFQALAHSSRAATRAGALLRLGRNLRKLKRYTEALGVYRQLAEVRGVWLDRIPAGLIALDARCSVLEALGRTAELQREASAVDEGLRGGRWSLTGAAWEFYRGEAGRRANSGPLPAGEREALAVSHAAEWILQARNRGPETKGFRVLAGGSGPVLVCWRAEGERLAAALVAPRLLATLWQRTRVEPDVETALAGVEGAIALGSAGPTGHRAARAIPGLPGTLLVTLATRNGGRAGAAIRRRLLLAGFAVLALILAAGTYFILRSMARERAVARMQSEFVAAVSHEFRTPVTSLRQLSEMLAQDRIRDGRQRQESYEVLVRASARLERLVESLLDFGRMEAGAFRYRSEPVDVNALAATVVEEFLRQAAPEQAVEIVQAEGLPAVRGDAESLRVALWNLLDNAVKYSPGGGAVRVETRRDAGGVQVLVRDRGVGIEGDEQRAVFDKFVRGAAARRSHPKGTGIGLTVARYVVEAHGGRILLESEVGRGSTFTIVLPAQGQP